MKHWGAISQMDNGCNTNKSKHYRLYKSKQSPRPPRCVVCAEANTPIAKMITVLTLMFLSFHTDFSSSAREAHLFVLSGQIFVKLLLRTTATSIRSSVLLALSSSTTSALMSCLCDSSYPRVAMFQHILFSVLISFSQPTFKQKLVGFMATFLCLLEFIHASQGGLLLLFSAIRFCLPGNCVQQRCHWPKLTKVGLQSSQNNLGYVTSAIAVATLP